MYSYNEVELTTGNITACDQEMVTFLLNEKRMLLKAILLVMVFHTKPFESSKSNDNNKKKVGFKLGEFGTAEECALTAALLPWEKWPGRKMQLFFYRPKISWYVTRHLGVYL